jgi:hypothetical protein
LVVLTLVVLTLMAPLLTRHRAGSDLATAKSAPYRDAFWVEYLQVKLRNVLVALNLAIFFVLDLRFFQLVGGIAHGVFRFANGVAGFAFSLLGQAFSLGFFVTSPLANLALCAASDVFCFSLNAFLIHEYTPSI